MPSSYSNSRRYERNRFRTDGGDLEAYHFQNKLFNEFKENIKERFYRADYFSAADTYPLGVEYSFRDRRLSDRILKEAGMKTARATRLKMSNMNSVKVL